MPLDFQPDQFIVDLTVETKFTDQIYNRRKRKRPHNAFPANAAVVFANVRRYVYSQKWKIQIWHSAEMRMFSSTQKVKQHSGWNNF